MKSFASYILLLTVIVVLVIGLFGCNDHHRRISDTLESEDTTTVHDFIIDSSGSFVILDTSTINVSDSLFGRKLHFISNVPPSHEQLVEEKLDEIISLLKEIKNKK